MALHDVSALRLLRDFLCDKGAIFVSLDDGEIGRLRLIADEIFGTNNFVYHCIWNKKYTRANDAKHFSDNHDHVVIYAREKSKLVIHRLERTDKQDRAYSNPNNHLKGPWKPTPLHAKSGEDESSYEGGEVNLQIPVAGNSDL
jgi:adenine-specific DNA-methyltransferase